MKNFIKIIFLSLVSLTFFSGCFEETAADATENFFYSVKEGNVEDYHKYSTESTQDIMNISFAKCTKDLSDCMKDSFQKFSKFKVVDSLEVDPTTAIVTVEEYTKDGKIIREKIHVSKIEEQWKVNLNLKSFYSR
ncbi:DUF4878 domain-containing protein [Arcobacter lacus]|uniref:DUF4878 domain-containing protein n=1 Tax=Arcobacter lacus TaxID=1912876 RepID=UPI0021BB9109|nr:DUF4878 domain-containing protein [Arcobacter lacus]MCT7909174.1 DUF4878 domain-containing protein [Arcobacter lacus]MCT7911383.1 DUF4878 domain-containing protein [Arcobacter lacus]